MEPLKVDLLNTPGIYYALSYWISTMGFLYRFPGRKRGWRPFLVQMGTLLWLGFFMTITHGARLALFVPFVSLDFLSIFLMVCLCCSGELPQLFYLSIRAFMFGELTASLEWQLFYYGLTVLGMPLNMRTNLLFLVPTHTVMFLAAWILESRVDRGQEPLRLRWSEAVLLFLIQIFFYAVSNISFVLSNTPFTTQHTAEIFIIRTLADFAGVGISFFYHLLMRQTQARGEAEHMRQLLEMQYANYRQSEESIAVVNRKYHDLKHQIALLRSGVRDEEKLAYLDQMEEEIRQYEAQNKTGNGILDTILAGKALVCQEKGISLNIVADGEALSFLHPMDVSSLFGNLLDNAIEGASTLPEKNERQILLRVSRQKGFLHIGTENRFAGELRMRNGLPLTTKEDAVYHGFGLRSIKSAAEKYGGSMRVRARNGWFSVNLLIPVPAGQDHSG